MVVVLGCAALSSVYLLRCCYRRLVSRSQRSGELVARAFHIGRVSIRIVMFLCLFGAFYMGFVKQYEEDCLRVREWVVNSMLALWLVATIVAASGWVTFQDTFIGRTRSNPEPGWFVHVVMLAINAFITTVAGTLFLDLLGGPHGETVARNHIAEIVAGLIALVLLVRLELRSCTDWVGGPWESFR